MQKILLRGWMEDGKGQSEVLRTIVGMIWQIGLYAAIPLPAARNFEINEP
jgi:hypothetical protein